MKNILSHQYIILLSRGILGLVFIIASIEKIAIPEVFAVNVQAYRVAPISLVNLIALIIPWIELLSGVFLISGTFIRSSATVLSGLLCFFIIMLVTAIFRGLTIDCGCFGALLDSRVGWFRVLEDIGLLLLGIHIIIFPKHESTVSTQTTHDEML
jgi:putative oxidoreductase